MSGLAPMAQLRIPCDAFQVEGPPAGSEPPICRIMRQWCISETSVASVRPRNPIYRRLPIDRICDYVYSMHPLRRLGGPPMADRMVHRRDVVGRGGRGLSAVGKLRVAGAERREAPVFWLSDQRGVVPMGSELCHSHREEAEDSPRRPRRVLSERYLRIAVRQHTVPSFITAGRAFNICHFSFLRTPRLCNDE